MPPYPDENTWWNNYLGEVQRRYQQAGIGLDGRPPDWGAFKWASRQGYDCYANDKDAMAAKHLAELERELGLTPAPPTGTINGRLRVSGPRVLDEAGPWKWKMVTGFLALRHLIDGKLDHLERYRDWTLSVGGNGWRVFGGFQANPYRPRLDYREVPGYLDWLHQLCTHLQTWGLRLQFDAICDSIPAGHAEQSNFLQAIADTLAQYPHTLMSLANEPWKNGVDPLQFDIRRPGLLVTRGSAAPDSPPYMPSLGFTTHHPPRGPEWWRKPGKDCKDIRDLWSHDFVIADEPTRIGISGNIPDAYFVQGCGMALFSSGGTMHGEPDTMQACAVPGAAETECARQMFAGIDLVPADAPVWTYARYGNANPGVPMPVNPPASGEDGRMHAMLGPTEGVVINYEDFAGGPGDPNWKAEARNGWTIAEQQGPFVRVVR